MNGKFKKQDVLAFCLDEVRSGHRPLRKCLDDYPELADELRPLVEIASSIRPREVHASPEFRLRVKLLLYREMNATLEPRSIFDRFPVTDWVPAFRTAVFVVVPVLIASLAGGTIYASQDSLPDEALYKVKTGIENIRLAVAFDPSDKADLQLRLSQTRVDEVAAQVRLNRTISASALAAVTENLNQAIININKDRNNDDIDFLTRLSAVVSGEEKELSLLVRQAPQNWQASLNETIRIARRANLVAGVAKNNPAFLTCNPCVRDEALEKGMLKISGPFRELPGDRWGIGDVILEKVNLPPGTDLKAGAYEIEGISHDGEFFVSKIISVSLPGDQIKIRGTFMGTSPDGSRWNISGLSIAVPEKGDVPEPGTVVCLNKPGIDSGPPVTWSKDTEWYNEDSNEESD